MNSQSKSAYALSNAKSDLGQYVVRSVTDRDTPILWRLLCLAAQMPGGDTPENVVEAQKHELLCHYVEGWGKLGDVGVIVETRNAEPVGAAWVRLGMANVWHEQGYSMQLSSSTDQIAVTFEDAPELAIALLPQFRNVGIGHALLGVLLNEAKVDHSQIQLNVRADNPAVRLYERVGFKTIGEMRNRVGGRSLVMLWSSKINL